MNKVNPSRILIAIFTLLAGVYVFAALQSFGLTFFAAFTGGILTIIIILTILMWLDRTASKSTGGVV